MLILMLERRLYLEAEYAYLVESISNRTKDDVFSSGDVENIFIIFKLPYLIEKADDGKVRSFIQNENYGFLTRVWLGALVIWDTSVTTKKVILVCG